MSNIQSDFHLTKAPHPHMTRCKAIMKKYPEIAGLMGRNPYTALILAALLAMQFTVAWWMGSLGFSYWWMALLLAYGLGAFANHSLYIIIHEATHNLIFRNRTLNRWMGVISDLPNVLPGAMGFHTYHLRHHAHLNEYENDTDLPGHWEAKLVGNSAWRKAVWLFLFPLIQVTRTFRMINVNTWTKWMIINIVVVLSVDVLIVWLMGPMALFYLFFSTLFALGLHPLGARWIQEHFSLHEHQETYSYYGPLNKLALNMGYHNEHHDFPAIPWNRLPEVKRMAPEFYDTLEYHASWSGLLLDFIFNPAYNLYSRVNRMKEQETEAKQGQIAALKKVG